MKNHKATSITLFLVLIVLASMVLWTGCSDDTSVTPVNSDVNSSDLSSSMAEVGYQGVREEYVPGELIVKFKSSASITARGNLLKAANADVHKKILTMAMKNAGDIEGLTVVRTPMSVMQAKSIFENSADVEYAEPNYLWYHSATSNDPYYTNGSMWGMYGDATTPSNIYGCQAGEAWAAGNTGSNTVYIGIIDEGAMYDHPDLVGQIWTNPFDPIDGIDNDGNGYIDDIHGWDFEANDNTTYDGTSDDHGTHVSGTIGAIGGNGIGVAGVAWDVQIITGKFLGRRGGSSTDAILAIDYFNDLKTRHGLNLPATNNSWGGGGYSLALEEAIGRAEDVEILFVAAAGNESVDNDVVLSYPGSYPNANVISVASITSLGALSSFSNWGATTVDIGAPGSSIYSTLPGKKTPTYGSYSGTSMACPHVTGGVALYSATHPGVSAATIKAAILGSAVPTASLSGKTVTGGRLNVSGF